MTAPPEKPMPIEECPSVAYAGDCYAFDEYRLWPGSRVLIRNNESVRLGARALDLLIALVKRSGQVVAKEKLFALVWPNRFIEESNLRVHIAALRKALGDGRSGVQFIASVPARGYVFVADVVHTCLADRKADPQERFLAALDHVDVFGAITRLSGRDEVVTELTEQIPRRTLPTTAGAGDIAKTAVARAAVKRIFNLAALTYSDSLTGPTTSFHQLFALNDEEFLQVLLTHLQPLAELLVPDNCECVESEEAADVRNL